MPGYLASRSEKTIKIWLKQDYIPRQLLRTVPTNKEVLLFFVWFMTLQGKQILARAKKIGGKLEVMKQQLL